MTDRQQRLARIQRDLSELRSRALRIQGEADATYRQVREIETEVANIIKETETQP
jgi:hypothetical protein